MTDSAWNTDADARSFCDALYARRPSWLSGTISHLDARYLFDRVLQLSPSAVVEVGTASGLSTTMICAALEVSRRQRGKPASFRLFTYDISPRFFADTRRQTGDAAREMLPQEALKQIKFRNPATAVDIRRDHAPDSIELMFLDANHKHPWPTLDVLAALDCLRPGSDIVLHDVNLPSLGVEHPQWGAKHLFDGIEAEKDLNRADDLPNIGACRVPADKQRFRDQLLEILYAHEWEDDVDAGAITAALT
jgi:predicted O-methyltransferase YrrM